MDNSSSVGITSTFTAEFAELIVPSLPTHASFAAESSCIPNACVQKICAWSNVPFASMVVSHMSGMMCSKFCNKLALKVLEMAAVSPRPDSLCKLFTQKPQHQRTCMLPPAHRVCASLAEKQDSSMSYYLQVSHGMAANWGAVFANAGRPHNRIALALEVNQISAQVLAYPMHKHLAQGACVLSTSPLASKSSCYDSWLSPRSQACRIEIHLQTFRLEGSAADLSNHSKMHSHLQSHGCTFFASAGTVQHSAQVVCAGQAQEAAALVEQLVDVFRAQTLLPQMHSHGRVQIAAARAHHQPVSMHGRHGQQQKRRVKLQKCLI